MKSCNLTFQLSKFLNHVIAEHWIHTIRLAREHDRSNIQKEQFSETFNINFDFETLTGKSILLCLWSSPKCFLGSPFRSYRGPSHAKHPAFSSTQLYFKCSMIERVSNNRSQWNWYNRYQWYRQNMRTEGFKYFGCILSCKLCQENAFRMSATRMKWRFRIASQVPSAG